LPFAHPLFVLVFGFVDFQIRPNVLFDNVGQVQIVRPVVIAGFVADFAKDCDRFQAFQLQLFGFDRWTAVARSTGSRKISFPDGQ
jgi:hypothetical protein